MSVYDSLPRQGTLDGVWSGFVATDAVDLNSEIEVVIPAFDSGYRFTRARFMARGASLPKRNDECLVVFDDKTKPCVIAWWSSSPILGYKITRGDIDDGPPASPSDGDIWIAEDVGAENSGIVWQFIYNADSSNAAKWERMGGTPLYARTEAQETTTSATYTNLSGGATGPSITLPRPGDYMVKTGGECHNGANGNAAFMSFDIGATPAVDADSIIVFSNSVVAANVVGKKRKDSLGAVTLTSKYRSNVGGTTVFFKVRFISAMPVRVQ